MKVKVVSIFRDKYTHKLYNPGEVIEIVDESRLKSPFLNKNSRKRLL